MKRETTYEASYKELTEIINELGNDAIPVDILARKVSRALELVNICKEKLLLTEREINALLKD